MSAPDESNAIVDTAGEPMTIEKKVSTKKMVSLSMNQYIFVVYLLPLVLLSGIVGNVFYTKKILADELISRPPIAVMPVRDAILKRVKGNGDPKVLDKAKSDVMAAGKQLKDNGYLVMDADYVFAYPGDVEALP